MTSPTEHYADGPHISKLSRMLLIPKETFVRGLAAHARLSHGEPGFISAVGWAQHLVVADYVLTRTELQAVKNRHKFTP